MPASVKKEITVSTTEVAVPTAEEFNAAIGALQGVSAENSTEIAKVKEAVAKIQAWIAAQPAAPGVKTGIHVPLYSWPYRTVNGQRVLHEAWQALIDLRKAVPDIEVLAKVNPDNGDFGLGIGLLADTIMAGAKPNAEMQRGIDALAAAGCKVAGYVYSLYGQRDPAIIKQRMALYRRLYPKVAQVMIDEMFYRDTSKVAYYKDLRDHAIALGFESVMANPGTKAPLEYASAVDCVIIYEDVGFPSDAVLADRTGNLPKDRFALDAHSTTYDSARVRACCKRVRWIFVTNDGSDGNPYDEVSPHLQAAAKDCLA